MNKDSKVYIAGHRGLVGSAILRLLKNIGYSNLIHRTHEELDLTNQLEVKNFFEREMKRTWRSIIKLVKKRDFKFD